VRSDVSHFIFSRSDIHFFSRECIETTERGPPPLFQDLITLVRSSGRAATSKAAARPLHEALACLVMSRHEIPEEENKLKNLVAVSSSAPVSAYRTFQTSKDSEAFAVALKASL